MAGVGPRCTGSPQAGTWAEPAFAFGALHSSQGSLGAGAGPSGTGVGSGGLRLCGFLRRWWLRSEGGSGPQSTEPGKWSREGTPRSRPGVRAGPGTGREAARDPSLLLRSRVPWRRPPRPVRLGGTAPGRATTGEAPGTTRSPQPRPRSRSARGAARGCRRGRREDSGNHPTGGSRGQGQGLGLALRMGLGGAGGGR